MRIAGLVLALGAATAALAQEDTRALWYSRTDNDLVFNTDRGYSSGMRLARLQGGVEYGLVHEIYSPEGKHWHPGVDDRAPVGRLLFSGAWQDRGEELYRTVEFFAGVRGPAAAARQITDKVHEYVSAAKIDWSRQYGNHIDFGMSFVHSQRLGPFTAHAGTVLGNEVAHLHGGLEWRYGSLPIATSAALRFAPTPPMPERGVYGWSVFAGASARGVLRNEFLTKNYDAAGPAIERRRVVGRAAVGAALTGRWGTIELEVIGDTREFDRQRRPQAFGSLAVHMNL